MDGAVRTGEQTAAAVLRAIGGGADRERALEQATATHP